MQPVPVDHIVVTPADTTVNVGQTVAYVATLYDANNNVLTGRTVTWSSSRPTRVFINSSTGMAFAIRSTATVVTITASSGGKSGHRDDPRDELAAVQHAAKGRVVVADRGASPPSARAGVHTRARC